MSQDCPELIFVAGPQKGQRVLLSRAGLVLGRGSGADVLLSEEFASRQQARYELLQAGPTLENLSDRGTWVNGKRYKAGKRLLLETGDLIGVGEQTEMLFVAAGDDPEAALAAYQSSAGQARNAFGRKTQPAAQVPQAAAQVETAQPAEASQPPPSPGEVRLRRPSEMAAGERLQAEAAARRRKIAIGLGIYLGLILLAGVLLKVLTSAPAGGAPGVPQLTDQQIEDALAQVPSKTPNRLLMEQRLEHAKGLYQQYGLESPLLYECVHAFKEALAYSGRNFFEDTEDEKMYRQGLRRLTEQIQERYRNAYLLEKAADWPRAEAAFRDLLAMLTLRDDMQKGLLFTNIQQHHRRVQYYLNLKKPGRRGPWM